MTLRTDRRRDQAPSCVGMLACDPSRRFHGVGSLAGRAASEVAQPPGRAAPSTRCRIRGRSRTAPMVAAQDASRSGIRPMTRAKALWTRRTRRRTHRMAPGSSMASRRTSFAAASRLLAPSAVTTTASSTSSVPGSRTAIQSGSRLKVVWLSGQYQRATRTPCGVLRSYVPCRAREQPPCGCFGTAQELPRAMPGR